MFALLENHARNGVSHYQSTEPRAGCLRQSATANKQSTVIPNRRRRRGTCFFAGSESHLNPTE